MTQIKTYNQISTYTNRYDPTRTTGLRNAFVRDMGRRFNELVQMITKTIVDEDCFGLNRITTHQMTPAGRESFAFPRSEEKVSRFMQWLQRQIDSGILDIREGQQVGKEINGAWTNKYIYDSYKRGVMRARYEAKRNKQTIPTIEQTGGIEISMSTPFHIDRLGLLYTRVYSDLKGVTAQMDTQISRVLSQGIADGDNPIPLARKLRAVVDGTKSGELGITDTLGRYIPAKRRAEMIARTEIIRAHHVATIQEYRNWAVEGVRVKGEWKTAGDDRVCDDCAELEEHIYSLDEIESMIPYHPNCRCVALPYVLREGSDYEKKTYDE